MSKTVKREVPYNWRLKRYSTKEGGYKMFCGYADAAPRSWMLRRTIRMRRVNTKREILAELT